MGWHTFQDCKSLKNVTLSKSLEEIKPYMFHGCIALTEITIPNSVTTITPTMGTYPEPFNNCPNLKNIYFEAGDNPIPNEDRKPWGAYSATVTKLTAAQ